MIQKVRVLMKTHENLVPENDDEFNLEDDDIKKLQTTLGEPDDEEEDYDDEEEEDDDDDDDENEEEDNANDPVEIQSNTEVEVEDIDDDGQGNGRLTCSEDNHEDSKDMSVQSYRRGQRWNAEHFRTIA
jgi:hypothetical protein